MKRKEGRMRRHKKGIKRTEGVTMAKKRKEKENKRKEKRDERMRRERRGEYKIGNVKKKGKIRNGKRGTI